MLTTLFLHLMLAAGISFAGSLQPGPVNLSVFSAMLRGHRSRAVWIALGGSLPETVYCAIAIWQSEWLTRYPLVITCLRYIMIALLAYLGWVYLRAKLPERKEELPAKSPHSGLAEGLLLGGLNPMLVVFWLIVISWLGMQGLFVYTLPADLAFCLGAFVGALAVHLAIIRLSGRLARQVQAKWQKRLLRGTGALLWLVGFSQLLAVLHLTPGH